MIDLRWKVIFQIILDGLAFPRGSLRSARGYDTNEPFRFAIQMYLIHA